MSEPRVGGAFRPDVVADAIRQPEFATLTARARRRRHRRLAAGVASFLAVVAAVVAVPTLIDRRDLTGGSGVGAPAGGAEAEFEARAAAIAAGWQRGGMAYTSGLAFVPLDELTRLTAESPEKPGTFGVEDTFTTEAQYQAFLNGRFTLSGTMPTTTLLRGTISVSGGQSISVPLASAQAAYNAMDRADATPGCDCEMLTVTGATLGTVRMEIGRGARHRTRLDLHSGRSARASGPGGGSLVGHGGRRAAPTDRDDRRAADLLLQRRVVHRAAARIDAPLHWRTVRCQPHRAGVRDRRTPWSWAWDITQEEGNCPSHRHPRQRRCAAGRERR